MNIGIVHKGRFPWNRGIGQLCEMLDALGHSPFLIARPGSASGRMGLSVPIAEIPPGATPDRDPFGLPPSPANPAWQRWIEEYARAFELDALIVRETHLARWALHAGKRLGVPVYLDMRENLAAMYAAGRAKNPLARPLRSRAFVRWFESRYVPRFEHVFTVSAELRAWALGEYALDPTRVSVLANYPSDTFLELADRALSAAPHREGPPILVYAGHIRETRGIQDVIAALPIVHRRFPEVRVRIIGSGDYTRALSDRAARLGVPDRVELRDMLAPEDLPAALAECHVGLSSYHLSEQTHQTVPGKLFEYMALGLPILASRRASVIRIMEETPCGVPYASTRPQDIAAAIEILLGHPEATAAMGRCGRTAVLERYNSGTNLDTLAAVLGRGVSR